MSRRPGLTIAALTAVGAGGYYLYNAGGSPKVAEKQFEHDAARLSSKIKSELPGSAKEAKTEAKLLGEQAGAKFDSTVDQARAKAAQFDKSVSSYAHDAEKKLESARKEAGKELNQAVDKFDKSVTDAASKTKSGISSWFGGK